MIPFSKSYISYFLHFLFKTERLSKINTRNVIYDRKKIQEETSFITQPLTPECTFKELYNSFTFVQKL